MAMLKRGAVLYRAAVTLAAVLVVMTASVAPLALATDDSNSEADKVQRRLQEFSRNTLHTLPTRADVPPALAWHVAKFLRGIGSKDSDVLAVVVGGARLDTLDFTREVISEDVWVYLSSVFIWSRCYVDSSRPKPTPLVLHSAEPLQNETVLTIFGGAYVDPSRVGKDDNFTRPFATTNEVWELRARPTGAHGIEHSIECTWTKPRISGPRPTARAGQASTFFQGHMYIYGGCSEIGQAVGYDTLDYCEPDNMLDDLWRYNELNQTWTRIHITGPLTPRLRNLAVMFDFSLAGESAIIIGGGFTPTSSSPHIERHTYTRDTFGCQYVSASAMTCEQVGNIPRLSNRGAVVVQSPTHALFLGVRPAPADNRLVADLYRSDGNSTTTIGIDPVATFNELLQPAIDGFSSSLQPLGGFTALWLTDPADVFIFGDFFNTVQGEQQSTWRGRFLEPQDPGSPPKVVWSTEFHLRTLTARAWAAMATLSSGDLVVSGGFSGTEITSVWSLQPRRLLQDSQDGTAAIVDPTAGRSPESTSAGPVRAGNGLPLLFWHRLDRDPLLNTRPTPRFGHAFVAIDDDTVFFGGGRTSQDGCFNDGWLFSLSNRTWTRVTATTPPHRGMTMVKYEDHIVAFGGWDCEGKGSNTVFVTRIGEYQWTEQQTTGEQPQPRGYCSGVLLPGPDGHTELVIFGGTSYKGQLEHPDDNLVYALNLDTFHWRRTTAPEQTAPSKRHQHCAVQIGDRHMVVIGGRTATSSARDVWRYDHVEQKWARIKNELNMPLLLSSARYGHVCSRFHDNTVLVVGGSNGNGYLSDVLFLVPACNMGQEGNLTAGTCWSCKRGTFRSNLSHHSCTSCAEGTTTNAQGAVDRQQCATCDPEYCRNGYGVIEAALVDIDGAIGEDADAPFLCQCRCHWSYYGQRCEHSWKTAFAVGLVFGLIGLVVLVLLVRYMYRQHRRVKHDVELKQLLLEESNKELLELESALSIRPEDLQYKDVLDEGAFGAVYLAHWLTQDRLVAVKKLRQALLMMDEDSKDDFLYEIRFIRTLHHRNIVWFYGANTNMEGDMFLVMEYVEKGDLCSILLDEGIPLSLRRRHGFMLDAARGMEYLHGRSPPRIHRDLKSKNLLVTDNWVVKVTDFTTAKRLADHTRSKNKARGGSSGSSRRGSSVLGGTRLLNDTRGVRARASAALKRIFSSSSSSSSSSDNRSDNRSDRDGPLANSSWAGDNSADVFAGDLRRPREDSLLHIPDVTAEDTGATAPGAPVSADRAREKMLQTTMFGTLPWLAPEVLRQEPYDMSVDVYSFGIVMSEIAARQLPFHDFSGSLRRAIVDGVRPTVPDTAPRAWRAMMAMCWDERPNKRPTFAAIVAALERDAELMPIDHAEGDEDEEEAVADAGRDACGATAGTELLVSFARDGGITNGTGASGDGGEGSQQSESTM